MVKATLSMCMMLTLTFPVFDFVISVVLKLSKRNLLLLLRFIIPTDFKTQFVNC